MSEGGGTPEQGGKNDHLTSNSGRCHTADTTKEENEIKSPWLVGDSEILNKVDEREHIPTENPKKIEAKPWIVMGDYNNVLQSNDRIGGNVVTEMKYKDPANMMQAIGLYEASTRRNYYMWTNKHSVGLIYSRIDNKDWKFLLVS
ncbi:unnamed protein product [Vicia faba]|uniref:Uncharacterized protein n=1 Tax=Vicia faba TaxID=3906 RepID=A0AAV1A332_VICFA|nr:unnamed protein product [Vicia faba]